MSGCSIRAPEEERRVDPAKAERIAERILNPHFPAAIRNVGEIAALVAHVEIHRRWQPTALECEGADRCLEGAGRAKGMAIVALRAAHLQSLRVVAEHLLQGERFRRIGEWRTAAVGVDIRD